ncbi:MAG: WD-40-like beta propeller repeat-containing protein, partial [Candidatus Magnetoglobus multicellularis str. Araruama]
MNSPDAPDMFPKLSADGKLLIFTSVENEIPNVYLYDLVTRSFVALDELTADQFVLYPSLSPDGTKLAYMVGVGYQSDIQIFNISNRINDSLGYWNTSANEMLPVIGGPDGKYLAFTGDGRNDGKGGYDAYLYDLENYKFIDLPNNINTMYNEELATISSDGKFMAMISNRKKPTLGHAGRDIYLMDMASKEFLHLPGLNSSFEDSAPSLSN